MELPKRKQNCLPEYDYSTPNAYFITVCTNNRKNLFWENVRKANGQTDVSLSAMGDIVRQGIENIPMYYPMISVDHFVIMPNHIHLLLQIDTDCGGRPMAAPTISTVINKTKGAISKEIGFSPWQKGFYDHIIWGEKDYMDIWNYIEGNPSKLTEDELCVNETQH